MASKIPLVFGGLGIFVVAGLVLPYLSGPPQRASIPSNIYLIISRDYGQTILGEWTFEPDVGMTGMEMLRNVTSVETRYGGMFVYSMLGLKSDISKRLDWLYYVNGVYMDRGLSSYRPRPGEVVQVDYHYWGGYGASPGFLSGYPNKLIFGVGGQMGNVTIVSPPPLDKVAGQFVDALASWGAGTVKIVRPSEAREDALDPNLIVLVTPEDCSFFSEIRSWKENAYWPCTCEDGTLWLRGLSREDRTRLDEGCAIQCMDFPANGRWALMILATDADWMAKGVKELNQVRSSGYAAAFALTPSGIVKLPVK